MPEIEIPEDPVEDNKEGNEKEGGDQVNDNSLLDAFDPKKTISNISTLTAKTYQASKTTKIVDF